MKERNQKISIHPKNYISKIEINDKDVQIQFKEKRKVALMFICLNMNYWRYLKQVIEDAKANFLPHHNVDFYVWTDIPLTDDEEFLKVLNQIPTSAQVQQMREFARSVDELNQINKIFPRDAVEEIVNYVRNDKRIHLIPTEPIEWPHGTLMRYHLFLQKEAELKKYDYVFYLDVDMRIVAKISDEVLGTDLTVAEHPMYALAKRFYPPYEPNIESAAFVPRLSKILHENGRPWLKPVYAAGGFQGGVSSHFIRAMKEMRKTIDEDFNKNYIAIWNDESHWNKYLLKFKGPILPDSVVVLSPAYIHPDSLIKEYYEPLWGCSYEPKIVTITKPWMLSKEAAKQIRDSMGDKKEYVDVLLENKYQCEKCGQVFQQPGHHIKRVVECTGANNPHKLEMIPLKV